MISHGYRKCVVKASSAGTADLRQQSATHSIHNQNIGDNTLFPCVREKHIRFVAYYHRCKSRTPVSSESTSDGFSGVKFSFPNFEALG